MDTNRPAKEGPTSDLMGAGSSAGVSVSVAVICAGCGLPLNRRGPAGECLRCALVLALRPEAPFGGEDEGLLADNAGGKLAGAVARYGHFEVAVGPDGCPIELGSGAMATTYRALDTVLRAPVALKVISQNVASNPAARARFLREARAAAKLHHPNVATVSHYGEQHGECFYVMELVEGETLAERVNRAGVFTPGQTLEVGVQVARALAAAEACGVIHRDLKPSNLMLLRPREAESGENGTPVLTIKVIDWGLAKAVSAEDELLGADHTRDSFVGTPAFASPEQFTRGDGRRIDTRSDIYSLGVTLWYLLCGKVPFVGDTLEAIHARQRALPLEQLRAARVPGKLAAVLQSMVAFDPADRPQSARELLDVLRHYQIRHKDPTPTTVHRRRSLQAIGLALLLLVGLAAGARAWRPHATSASVPGNRPSLAVLPFKSLDPAPANLFFTLGMQEEIIGDLALSARMRVLSIESTRVYNPDKPRDYREIARALRVSYLLEGIVGRTNEGVEITVRLMDSSHPDRVWQNTYRGSVDNVFGLQSQITNATAVRMQVSLDAREKSGIDRPLTADPEAHDLYLRARAMEQEDTGAADDVQVHHDQLPLLEAAVARDPHFTRAYCDLSGVYLWLYNIRALTPAGKETVDYRSLADVALAKARRLEPDSGEVHLATANILYTASHDDEQARIEADLARAILPNNRDVEFLTGEIAFGQGYWREAMHFLERAGELDPLNWRQRFDVAQYYRHLRQPALFEQAMARVLDDVTAEDAGYYKSVRFIGSFELQGNPAPLEKAVTTLSATDDPDGRARCVYGFLLGLFSHDANVAARALSGYHDDPVRQGTHLYPRAWYEALVARLRGDEGTARAAFAAARNWMAGQAAANTDDGWMLSMLAVIDAGLDHKEDAVREALRAVELTPYGRDLDYASCVRGNLAITYAWTAQPEQALDVLESLVDKPGSFDIPAQPSFGDLRLNPCWDSLRGNPRFEAVILRFARPIPGS